MFSKLALISAFVGLVAGKALDVWNPPITSPTAHSAWPVGSTQNVTWDTSTKPAQVTNPIGKIVLAKDGTLDDENPLASGFQLTDGWHLVTVPPDTVPGDDYTIVVFGDSGNNSPVFRILAA
ncbi:hypothetical protein EIP86_010067 [Pleurotus ostreatoroseus]|nr:hypothetical protein EIP86_010067 [Pleurotus ostreatoroseus]